MCRTLFKACLPLVGTPDRRSPVPLFDRSIEANHVVHEGKLKKGSIVRLKSYQANAVKGKRFVGSCQLWMDLC
jgi:hypothetical protein